MKITLIFSPSRTIKVRLRFVSVKQDECGLLLTTESCDGPVSPNIEGPMGQLKGKRSCVWVQVSVKRSDVDGVWLWPLTYLCLLGEYLGSIVIDIQQVDLESACATCWRFTCMGHEVARKVSTYIFMRKGIYIWIRIYATGMPALILHSLRSR